MKRSFASFQILRTLSASATLLVLTLGIPTPTKAAAPIKGKVGRINDNQVTAQYLGTDDKSYVFRIEFANPDAKKFSFIIKNDEDAVVYEGQFSDVHFAKTVRLPKDELVSHPTFIIRNGAGEVKRSFTVSRIVTEQLVVTKS